MAKKNEAKYEILSLVEYFGELTSSDVSVISGRTIFCSSRLLKHYHDMGLLNRYWDEGCYHYSLSDRGDERLDWLKECFDE